MKVKLHKTLLVLVAAALVACSSEPASSSSSSQAATPLNLTFLNNRGVWVSYEITGDEAKTLGRIIKQPPDETWPGEPALEVIYFIEMGETRYALQADEILLINGSTRIWEVEGIRKRIFDGVGLESGKAESPE